VLRLAHMLTAARLLLLLSQIAKQLDIADRGRFDADKCRVKAAITKVEQNRNKTSPTRSFKFGELPKRIISSDG